MKFTLRSLIVLLLVCFSATAFAQTSGIAGVLVDEKGQPIISGSVVVTQGGINVGGGVTGFDGDYSIKPLTPGRYDIKFSYLGKSAIVTGVVVTANSQTTVNQKIVTSNQLTETVVTAYRKPLIDIRNPTKSTHDAETIEHTATTSVSDVASLSTQAYQGKNGAGLSLGGGRVGTGTTYVVDGITLASGNASFSNPILGSVEQVTTYVSGIPARYGDASGGVVTITTKGITPKLRGGLRLQQSVDGYDNKQGSLNLSGPLLSKRIDSTLKKPIIGFTLDAEGIYNKDDDPSFYKNYSLNDQRRSQIESHPLMVLPNSSGEPNIYYATESVKMSDLTTTKRRQNADYESGRLAGKLIYSLNENVNVALGASFFGSDRGEYSPVTALFNSDANRRTVAYTGRGFVRFTQKFGKGSAGGEKKENAISNAFYTLQADYQKDYSTLQDQNHKHNTFDYGYVGKFEQDLAPVYQPGYDDSTGQYGLRLLGYQTRAINFTRSEINPLLANYTSDFYNLSPVKPTLLGDITSNRGLLNGDNPSRSYNLYENVGFANTGWSQTNNDQIAVQVDASFDYKYKKTTHSIEFGLSYQQRNERYYAINGASLWTLARSLTNLVVNQNEVDLSKPYFLVNGVRYTREDYLNGLVHPNVHDTIVYDRLVKSENQQAFDKNLRTKLNLPVNGTDYINTDALDPSFFSVGMFSPDELNQNGSQRVNYFGYDYTGKRETGQINFDDYWTKKDATNSYYTRPIGAYRPNYIAGYLSDYIQFKDFLITLGMRVERFDANTKVLKDPYSLVPVREVGAVPGANNTINGGSHPGNIGSGYVVYVSENTSKAPSIIGYRNGDTWYDARGNEVSDPVTLKTGTGSSNLVPYINKDLTDGKIVNVKDSNFKASNSFTDYKPQVNVMPRINFSFPLNENALFYAHYDVLVQRPVSTSPGLSTNYATPQDYYYMTENASAIIGNPDLKPEKMIDYEVGFQQKISSQSALTIAGFYKARKDQIQIRSYYQAYPTTYYTYGNRDFSTTKGLSLNYDLRRIGNISMVINYTLSFSEGSGSSATSANGGSGTTANSNSGLLANYISAGVPNQRNQFPLTYDSRHNINAQIDYRYRDNDGPTIGGVHFLENAGANLVFRTRSGEPYTRYADPNNLAATGSGNLIAGGVNASRLPWHYMFDLNLDKDFVLNFRKGGTLMSDRRRNGGLSFNVFAYVQNLFNTKDILAVYGYTGRAGDDGFLTSAQGVAYVNQRQDQQAFKDLYNLSEQNLYQLNNPRRIVIGLKMNF